MNSEQIAKLAGVSRSTVSKVLHDYPDIPIQTKQKVLKVIKEQGYRPNAMSQSLKGISPNVISLYMYISQEPSDDMVELHTHYMMSVLSSVAIEARRRNYSVLVEVIASTDDENEVVQMITEAFDSKRTGAAIFVGLTDDAHFLSKIANNDRHIIVLDKKVDTATGVRCIFSNDTNGGKRATEHLLNNGYRNILHISGDLKKLSARSRRDGYLEAIQKYNELNHTELESNVLSCPYSFNAGYNMAKQFISKGLDEKYDSIMFGADSIAHGFMSYIRQVRPDLLDTLGMIGFDNEPQDIASKPTLSTMATDYSNLAHIIFNLEQNYDQFSGGISLIVEHKLIERESSMPKDKRIAETIIFIKQY